MGWARHEQKAPLFAENKPTERRPRYAPWRRWYYTVEKVLKRISSPWVMKTVLDRER